MYGQEIFHLGSKSFGRYLLKRGIGWIHTFLPNRRGKRASAARNWTNFSPPPPPQKIDATTFALAYVPILLLCPRLEPLHQNDLDNESRVRWVFIMKKQYRHFFETASLKERETSLKNNTKLFWLCSFNNTACINEYRISGKSNHIRKLPQLK